MATPKPLHPAYTVTNIQNKVRILDGTKVTYNSWVKLFTLHARGYKVLSHIDGTPAPAKTDPSHEAWIEIDAIVLQWIYETLSNDLLIRVLDTDTTAYKAWQRLKEIFTNNKGSRAAALEHEFTNLTLQSAASLDDYCQKLKDISNQLADIESPVPENRLVLQMVRGLPPEYDTVASYINQTLPDWDTARSMLQLEEHRQTARQPNPSVLVTPSAPPSEDRPPSSYSRDYNSQRNPGRDRGRNTQPGRGGRNTQSGRGRGFPAQNTQPPSLGYQIPPWAWWTPPPCPYPTSAQTPQAQWAPTAQQQNWIPWSNSQQQASRPAQSQSANVAFSSATPAASDDTQQNSYDALVPSDIGQAFQAMHLNTPDPSWFMDTGASSHLTSDSGNQDWEDSFTPQ